MSNPQSKTRSFRTILARLSPARAAAGPPRHLSLCLLGLCCLAAFSPGILHAQNNAPEQSPGAPLFVQNCAACHGSDGRGGERAPNIATRHEVVVLSDLQLRDILTRGVPAAGMPSFSYLGNEKIDALVHHLRVLQGMTNTASAKLPGDPRAGQQLFFADARCSSCHMMHGKGGFMGEDLSDYARGRSAETIHAAIVHPDPANAGNLVDIETAAGQSFRGLIRAQDNFTVVLQSEDGAFHSLSRNTIRHITTSPGPLMPQDYGKKLTDAQVNDIVSYLLSSAGSGKPKPNTDDDDD